MLALWSSSPLPRVLRASGMPRSSRSRRESDGNRAKRLTHYGVRVEAANSDVEALSGGNASASVLRIGDTVRKPWLQTTDLTVAYMRVAARPGHRPPEPRGRDDRPAGPRVRPWRPRIGPRPARPLATPPRRRPRPHDPRRQFRVARARRSEVLLPADRRPPTRCTADDDGAAPARAMHRPSPFARVSRTVVEQQSLGGRIARQPGDRISYQARLCARTAAADLGAIAGSRQRQRAWPPVRDSDRLVARR